jgi:hypothetical protein
LRLWSRNGVLWPDTDAGPVPLPRVCAQTDYWDSINLANGDYKLGGLVDGVKDFLGQVFIFILFIILYITDFFVCWWCWASQRGTAFL